MLNSTGQPLMPRQTSYFDQTSNEFISDFAAGALGDSIRFGIFVVYQFHPGT